MLASAVAFCVSNVAAKAVFDATNFVSGFLWIKLGGVAMAAGFLASPSLRAAVRRSTGRARRIIRIKRFEHPEAWERRYQAVRDQKDDRVLAEFLGEKLSAVAADHPADVIVIGGGVLSRQGFRRRLSSARKRRGVRRPVRLARLGRNAAAIGAVLLFP